MKKDDDSTIQLIDTLCILKNFVCRRASCRSSSGSIDGPYRPNQGTRLRLSKQGQPAKFKLMNYQEFGSFYQTVIDYCNLKWQKRRCDLNGDLISHRLNFPPLFNRKIYFALKFTPFSSSSNRQESFFGE